MAEVEKGVEIPEEIPEEVPEDVPEDVLEDAPVEMPVDSTSSNLISVLVAGGTRTGKSTLVNALLDEKVAIEGGTLDTETSSGAEPKIKGIDATVWDSPGLQDGTKNGDKYLEDIKKECNGKIDLLLTASPLIPHAL